jgi:hypothetical protein
MEVVKYFLFFWRGGILLHKTNLSNTIKYLKTINIIKEAEK